MPMNAVFQADFSRWDSALKNAQQNLKSFEVTGKGVQQQLERMARSFSGVEIKKQADLAAASVKAIGGASKLTENEQRRVNATVTEAIAKYKALGQSAPAELKKLQAETANVEKKTSLLGGSLVKIGGALAAAFTVTAVTNAIRSTLEYAGSIQDLAAATGFGVERLQELKFAAEQNGTTLDAVTNAAFRLQQSIGKGTKGAATAVGQLGLSLSQLKQLRPEDQFTVVASKLGEVKNQADRAAIGAELMGRGFKEVAPIIVAGLDAQIAKAREYGLVLDEETIGALDDLGDAWDAVKLAGTAFIAKALVPLAPIITEALQALLPFASKIGELPGLMARAEIAVLKLAQAQAEFAISLIEISKITNPLGALAGHYDKVLGDLRLSVFAFGNQVTLLQRKLDAGGNSAAATAKKFAGLGKVTRDVSDEAKKAAASAEKAYQTWASAVTGLDRAMAAAELDRRLERITQEGRLNQAAIAAILKEYEALRPALDQLPPRLEAFRVAHQRLLVPLEAVQRHLQAIASRSLPDANKMYLAGQAAMQGFSRNGTLVSRTLVDVAVAMRAVPFQVFGEEIERAATLTEQLAVALKDNLTKALAAIPDILIQGLLHGADAQDTAVAIGSKIGAAIGSSIAQALAPGNPAAAAIGEAIGALVGPLIDVLITTRAERTVKRVAYEFGVSISEELAKGIEDEAERRFGGNRQAAKIFNLDKIISEGGGLNSENFRQLFSRFRDLFSMVETGAFTSAQAIEVLDENFRTFADFVTKGGSLANRELLDIIHLTDRFGLKSAEVSQFVVEQTTGALGGLTTFLENAQVRTQAAATGIAASVFGIFEAQTANGVPAAEIIRQLDPLINQLDEQFKAAGLSGGAAFDQIRSLAAVAGHEIAGPLITGVLGLEQALAGLHNSGVLNEEMFDGLTAAVADTYQEILGAGVNGSQALQLIAPTLQTIWELSEDFGYSVDAATQALLDEAEAAGLVGDEHRTAQEQMLRLTERMTVAIEGLATMFGVVLPDAVGEFSDALDNIEDPQIYPTIHWPEIPEFDEIPQSTGERRLPNEGTGVPGFASGTPGLGFLDFGSGTRVDLHNREAVVPEDQVDEFVARHSAGGTTINLTLNISAMDGESVKRVVQGREFSDALVESLARNTHTVRTRTKAALA